MTYMNIGFLLGLQQWEQADQVGSYSLEISHVVKSLFIQDLFVDSLVPQEQREPLTILGSLFQGHDGHVEDIFW